MARRPFFRRRGMRRPKTPVSWVSTLFNETALTVDASATALQVLLDDDDWQGDLASLRKIGRVRRIIYDGHVMWVPLATADAADMVSLLWCLWVGDQSDDPVAAATLNSTASGSVLQERRVLQTGIVAWTAIETTGGFLINEIPSHEIHIDMRTNVNVPPGSRLGMGFVFQSSAAASINVAACSAVSRILIVTP